MQKYEIHNADNNVLLLGLGPLMDVIDGDWKVVDDRRLAVASCFKFLRYRRVIKEAECDG